MLRLNSHNDVITEDLAWLFAFDSIQCCLAVWLLPRTATGPNKVIWLLIGPGPVITIHNYEYYNESWLCVGVLNSYDIREKEALSIVHGPDYIQFNWEASCKTSIYKFTIWNNLAIYYLIHAYEVSKCCAV